MLSRLADFSFWLGRNVERAETLARVLDVNHARSVDLYGGRDGRSDHLWESVMSAIGFRDDPLGAFGDRSSAVLGYVAFDPTNASSIVSSVRVARSSALGIRSELTTEVWEVVNVLYLFVEGQDLKSVLREGPSRFLRRVRDMCQSFAGVSDATMSHGEGWNFLQAGRYLERAYLTARILAAVDVENEPWHESQRLLEMCCASVPFAQQSHRAPEARDALAFILLSEEFPRSVRFATRAVSDAMRRISRNPIGSSGTVAERRLGRLCAVFDFTPLEELVTPSVEHFAHDIQREFEALSSEIESVYFPRLPVPA